METVIVNDGRYPLLLINLRGRKIPPYCPGKGRILWIKSILIPPLYQRIDSDSDSLTNPSLLHPFYFAHLFPSSRYRYRTNDVKTISIRKKKKKRTLNPSLNPSFRSSFSITISSTKKTKDRATLLSPFPHFPLVLSPPRGKNYSVDESQSREQGG